jgi:hypothetical protein
VREGGVSEVEKGKIKAEGETNLTKRKGISDVWRSKRNSCAVRPVTRLRPHLLPVTSFSDWLANPFIFIQSGSFIMLSYLTSFLNVFG